MVRVVAAACLTMLLGCASGGDISTHVDYCCGPKGPALSTYSITFVTTPGFLATTLHSELVAALTARGWREAAAHPDVLITVQYAAIYPQRAFANDGFADPLSNGGPRTYDAQVTVDVKRASDGVELLRGTLSREHTESVGDYGHESGRAAIRAAFDRLVGRLPKA